MRINDWTRRDDFHRALDPVDIQVIRSAEYQCINNGAKLELFSIRIYRHGDIILSAKTWDENAYCELQRRAKGFFSQPNQSESILKIIAFTISHTSTKEERCALVLHLSNLLRYFDKFFLNIVPDVFELLEQYLDVRNNSAFRLNQEGFFNKHMSVQRRQRIEVTAAETKDNQVQFD